MASAQGPAPQPAERSGQHFGEQIAAQRRARGLTQRALAQAVGLSPEHLSRIEHGRRPPPRRTVVVLLCAALGAAPESDLTRHLLAAAGYLPETRPGPAAQDAPDQDHLQLPRGGAALAQVAQLPAALHGAQAFAQAALLLLRAAAERDIFPTPTVSLSLHSTTQAVLSAPEMQANWYEALRALMARGWQFHHLWQLQGSVVWPTQVITELSALTLWSRNYHPRQVHRAAADQPGQDLLVVPGVAALASLHGGDGAHTTLVIREPEQIQAVAAHLSRVLHGARPLLSTSLIGDYGTQGNASRVFFTEMLAGAHEVYGEHRLVKSGIPLRFVPSSSWWQDAIRGLPANGADPRRSGQELAYRRHLWECRQRVRRSFAAEMRISRHREICTTDGLKRFVEDGAVSSDDFLLDGLPPLPREERADALLNLIQQLNANPNYELALVDKESQLSAGMMWLVKGSGHFSLSAVHRGPDEQRQDFMAVITDERLVGGFRDHFDRLWEGLPSRWRDKPRVEHWLDRQIETLH